MTEEMLLGDYTITLSFRGRDLLIYHIYLHNKHVGRVSFLDDMPTLDTISTDDTDLITILLLKYQVSSRFEILPYYNPL